MSEVKKGKSTKKNSTKYYREKDYVSKNNNIKLATGKKLEIENNNKNIKKKQIDKDLVPKKKKKAIRKYKNSRKYKFISIISIFMLCMLSFILFYSLKPIVKLQGNTREKISLNTNYKEKGYKAIFFFNDVSNHVSVRNTIDNTKVGVYKINYYVKEGLFSTKVVREVEVVDDIKPVITLVGDENVSICPNKEYEEQGFTATDNYDGDLTNKVKVIKKDDIITYKVHDSSKNEISISRKIVKEDKANPTISLKGNDTKYIRIGSNYVEEGVTVTDNCDELNDKVVTKGTVDTSKVGTYTITYEVEDLSGNKASTSRKVIVYANTNNSSGAGIKGAIYLTFDDGPSQSITPRILDILKNKGVKATFFVINHSDGLNYLIKREHDEGHTVALHSYTHDYRTIYSSSNAYFNDLNLISNKVKNITGVESKIIRFPGGTSNTVSRAYSKGIMTYLSNEVRNRGYIYFDWNVDSDDAGSARSSQQVYNNVVYSLSKNRSNVVLMHDFENNNKTLNALSDIIDYGLSNGFSFNAIDMSTAMVVHNPNN